MCQEGVDSGQFMLNLVGFTCLSHKLLKCQIFLTAAEVLKDEHASELYIDITFMLYTPPGNGNAVP